jgi:glutathione peroxidase
MLLMLIISLLVSNPTTVYEFKPLAIDGKATDLSQYKGKKILIVNTASECGNTPQYTDLKSYMRIIKTNGDYWFSG